MAWLGRGPEGAVAPTLGISKHELSAYPKETLKVPIYVWIVVSGYLCQLLTSNAKWSRRPFPRKSELNCGSYARVRTCN